MRPPRGRNRPLPWLPTGLPQRDTRLR
jgi:hypothetical protein